MQYLIQNQLTKIIKIKFKVRNYIDNIISFSVKWPKLLTNE